MDRTCLPVLPETVPLRACLVASHEAKITLVTSETVRLEIAGLAVEVPAPVGAEFSDLEGLPAPARNTSWSPGPGWGAFMVSTGDGPGHTADGFVAAEHEEADAVDVQRDEIVAGPAGPARRIALRSNRHEERVWVEGENGGPVEVPEHEAADELEFVFTIGPEGDPVRIGYRVPADAPDEVRALLRRMLDETRVEPL